MRAKLGAPVIGSLSYRLVTVPCSTVFLRSAATVVGNVFRFPVVGRELFSDY
jgi:hypothetical protein